jgi:hypothetical protein
MFLKAAALLFTSCVGVGCARQLSEEECGSLLDQYVSLLAASDRAGTPEAELLRLKALARKKAAQDPAFSRCSSEVSRTQFECAMQAENVDRLEQCLL